MEDGAADAGKLSPRNRVAQMRHRCDAQHHQVAWLGRLCEAPPGLQAGVADLHDLIGEQDVRPNMNFLS